MTFFAIAVADFVEAVVVVEAFVPSTVVVGLSLVEDAEATDEEAPANLSLCLNTCWSAVFISSNFDLNFAATISANDSMKSSDILKDVVSLQASLDSYKKLITNVKR